MSFLKHLVNRNPRSLEKIRLAQKHLGYQYEKDAATRVFYYKLQYECSLRNVTARVIHYKDGEIASASTIEPEVHKRLHSRVDYSANFNIGRLLAYRCLKAGITHVKKGITSEEYEKLGTKPRAFYDGCSEGGLFLDELPTFEVNWDVDKRYHFVVPEQQKKREYRQKFIPPPTATDVAADDKEKSPAIDDEETKKESKGKKKRAPKTTPSSTPDSEQKPPEAVPRSKEP